MTEMNGAPGNVAQSDLPSSRTLLRSTAIAVVVALVLLVTIVLPAEYGVDPTRIGRLLGLTQMGEIKVALANEAAADAAADAAAAADATVPVETAAQPAMAPPTAVGAPTQLAASDSASNRRETSVTLQPGEGKEVKLVMQRGARATYAWSTDGGVVNFLTHGDTANAPANSYHTYGKGSGAQSDTGAIVAAFDGMHGWFWRNRTERTITVTLRTSGEYREIKQPK